MKVEKKKRYLSSLASYLMLLGLLLPGQLYAQSAFTVAGKVAIDTSEVVIAPMANATYYPMQFRNEITLRLDHGRFEFRGALAYPTAFVMGRKINGRWRFMSTPFFIEAGKQELYSDLHSVRTPPRIDNKAMNEFVGEYTRHFAAIDALIDDINTTSERVLDSLNNEKEKQLVGYTKAHPDSYVALWMLAYMVSHGYKPVYDEIYKQLSPALAQTFTGQQLRKNMDLLDLVAIGQPFPSLQIVDANGVQTTIPDKSKRAKYTLIDFWFSTCPPCLAQMPEYKRLYEKYKDKGFAMIGVSVDQDQRVEGWRNVIANQNLSWPQYLDKDLVHVSRMGISRFPDNFLLDSNGVIIRREISLVELGKLLGGL